MASVSDVLTGMGVPPGDLHGLPDSGKTFPDGAAFRIEIPSTEGPGYLRAVLDEAALLDVPVHRVSQGGGIFMLTDRELDEMVQIAVDAPCEVSLYARANAGWDISAGAVAPGGGALAASARGQDQVLHAVADIRRAAEHGVRSVLIADLGVLALFGQLRSQGVLPSDMQAKVSVNLPISNPLTARVLVDLGADTLNLSTDLTLAQIAGIRQAVDVPLDIYIEAADVMGGFVRTHDLPEIIRVAAPVYVKLGVRNAPDIYPVGRHLEATALALSRERVRRARLALETLARSGTNPRISELGAEGLALPQPG